MHPYFRGVLFAQEDYTKQLLAMCLYNLIAIIDLVTVEVNHLFSGNSF